MDPAVVNLTVFETFYEERRPFFIEGSQAFDHFGRNGASGYLGFNRTNPSLFYSRRIGRTPQGAATGEYVDRPTSNRSQTTFAALDQTESGMETRLNLILSPRMSLQMYLQPLVSVGQYSGFKEAAQPRTYDFLRDGQDTGTISYDAVNGASTVYPGPGGTGTPFLIPDPDFNFTSLRANTVFRWEFKPGSTLCRVWTQQREDETSDGRFAFNQDISRMMRAPGDNLFMVKMSYWFGR